MNLFNQEIYIVKRCRKHHGMHGWMTVADLNNPALLDVQTLWDMVNDERFYVQTEEISEIACCQRCS